MPFLCMHERFTQLALRATPSHAMSESLVCSRGHMLRVECNVTNIACAVFVCGVCTTVVPGAAEQV